MSRDPLGSAFGRVKLLLLATNSHPLMDVSFPFSQLILFKSYNKLITTLKAVKPAVNYKSKFGQIVSYFFMKK